MFRPRPKQLEILKYTNGKMGISAVPGSGKTQTLSYLAANLLFEGRIEDDQEILVVTLVNAAVNNFSNRISGFMEGFGLLPGVGYRVRTLHGLAHDIVRERPDLVGLGNEFEIIDERETNQILDTSVESWLKRNPNFIDRWGKQDYTNNLNRNQKSDWQSAVSSVCTNFIRTAKDLQLSPQEIYTRLSDLKIDDSLLNLGADIYEDYQRALNYRSAVDFDDLIRLALLSLQIDPDYLNRLRYLWPFILEDEAQDSSRLQEFILQTLVGENGNWVRVGDPNQAIFESFTTASPEYLKNYLAHPDVSAKTLPNSGRSTQSIINLANELIRWTNQDHPIHPLRSSLTKPFIEPTPKYDPQPNPEDHPEKIFLFEKQQSSDQEIKSVIVSLGKWLPVNPDNTVAILVPRNFRGGKIVEALQKEKIPYVEILQTSQSTRNTAAILAAILNFLESPNQTTRLIKIFDFLSRIKFSVTRQTREEIVKLIRSCNYLEEFLFPVPDHDWIHNLFQQEKPPENKIVQILLEFRTLLSRWLKAADLPIHQTIITISQEIFEKPADLALAHKLALILEQYAKNHPDWLLPQFAEELTLIAENRRKLQGFSDEESSFNPEMHKGKVVVTTYHKAKGLEWDRVYLMSVNDYDFPSATIGDHFISEKHIYKDEINLEAEINQKLKALANSDLENLYLEYGFATEQARLEYAAERIRLFFVGITRAKKELIITWNTGDTHHRNKINANPSIPFLALAAFWEKQNEI
ncbi:MAG: ATP-dependent helicase [Chloroflexi bacterium HGW-Chloroflexi-3]|nr:MAG: ATP-dependent helicase [Chloroflexi bacterium HGW-Chloroflexi-3]